MEPKVFRSIPSRSGPGGMKWRAALAMRPHRQGTQRGLILASRRVITDVSNRSRRVDRGSGEAADPGKQEVRGSRGRRMPGCGW